MRLNGLIFVDYFLLLFLGGPQVLLSCFFHFCRPPEDNLLPSTITGGKTPSDDAIFKTGTLVNRLVRSLLNHQIAIGPPHLLKATTSL